MRKIFFTLVLSMAVITASFHAQVKRFVIKEQKTNKSINIAVFASDSYKSNVYRQCEAKLEYRILKVRRNRIDTVVCKELPKVKLKELSTVVSAFNEHVEVKDVVDRKEQVWVLYTVTYLSNGSALKIEHEKLIAKKDKEDSLVINI